MHRPNRAFDRGGGPGNGLGRGVGASARNHRHAPSLDGESRGPRHGGARGRHDRGRHGGSPGKGHGRGEDARAGTQRRRPERDSSGAQRLGKPPRRFGNRRLSHGVARSGRLRREASGRALPAHARSLRRHGAAERRTGRLHGLARGHDRKGLEPRRSSRGRGARRRTSPSHGASQRLLPRTRSSGSRRMPRSRGAPRSAPRNRDGELSLGAKRVSPRL